MTLFERGELERLAGEGDGPRISVYLPTHRVGAERLQDPIRFKNLLNAVEEDLVAAGLRRTVAADRLAPARALLDDGHFWAHQADGLAVFISEDDFHVYRAPFAFEALAVVSDRYHVKPLLPLVSTEGRFWVLAISQARVRLFEATRDTMREVDLHDVPESLPDVVGYDWEERSLQFHSGPRPSTGQSAAVTFHGQGAPEDDHKDEIARFLREVDQGVRSVIGDDGAPVVLAGVRYVTAMYRSLTGLPRVLEDGLDGSPDRLTPGELHEGALRLVEPGLDAAYRAGLETFAALAGTGRAQSDLRSVLEAAHGRRVETLFVASDAHRWGTFDEASSALEEHPYRQPGDGDLLDLAAARSLLAGADVYAVASDRVPGGAGVAAILRY